MGRKFGFKFYATVSERGQIFIPKALQDYFGITKCDRVSFVVQENGSVIFKKKEGEKR
ncbi:MAG: hypothetical protein HQ594_00520 [Candidatus Omnitrophica bacterium]|nr:hypothetical protein [Candidatus Omnitrophota bacterium]